MSGKPRYIFVINFIKHRFYPLFQINHPEEPEQCFCPGDVTIK
jgi:hypothetical protein